MAHKQLRFKSLTFIFSDKFGSLLDNSFTGCLICEYKLDSKFRDIDEMSFPDRYLFILDSYVKLIDKPYKQARMVVNADENKLLMYQLGTSDTHIYRLNSSRDCSRLLKLYEALKTFSGIQNLYLAFVDRSKFFKKQIQPQDMSEIFKLDKSIDTSILRLQATVKRMSSLLSRSFNKFLTTK